MRPDLILSNAPYGKPGVDITKHLMANHDDSQISILGTKSMFNKHYGTVALEYVQVGEYQYDPKGGKTKRMDWGVKQAIILGWHRKGHTWTEVIPKQTVHGGGSIRLTSKRVYFIGGGCSDISQTFYNSCRTLPVYGPIDFGGNTHIITNLVCTEQELPQIEHIKWVSEMNPNYVWKAFETLEEAISAAVYLGSWKTPSDSHNRLKELGFIDILIPHEE